MHLTEYKTILMESNKFFNKKTELELDEDTFFIWKTELKKELPSFWEKMGGIP